MTILLIVIFAIFLAFTFPLVKTKEKKKTKKINTNYLTRGYYNPESQDILKEFLYDPGHFTPETYLDFCKKMDRIYNEFTLEQLKMISSLLPSSSMAVVIHSFITLKEADNKFFKKYPASKPDYYKI